MDKWAIYVGTFDPITDGHLDIIRAGLRCFDGVFVAVMENPKKAHKHMFTIPERIEMINRALVDRGLYNENLVRVCKGNETMTVDEANSRSSKGEYGGEHFDIVAILRGLRLSSDYETELTMAFNNAVFDREIQTVLIPPVQEHIHISSTIVRDLIDLGQFCARGASFVSPSVYTYIMETKNLWSEM